MQMLEGYINVNCAMYIYNIQWIWFNMSLVWAQSSWPNYDLIWCICTYYTMFLIQNKPQGPLDKSFWSICPFHGAIFNTHTHRAQGEDTEGRIATLQGNQTSCRRPGLDRRLLHRRGCWHPPLQVQCMKCLPEKAIGFRKTPLCDSFCGLSWSWSKWTNQKTQKHWRYVQHIPKSLIKSMSFKIVQTK